MSPPSHRSSFSRSCARPSWPLLKVGSYIMKVLCLIQKQLIECWYFLCSCSHLSKYIHSYIQMPTTPVCPAESRNTKLRCPSMMRMGLIPIDLHCMRMSAPSTVVLCQAVPCRSEQCHGYWPENIHPNHWQLGHSDEATTERRCFMVHGQTRRMI